MPHPGTRLCCRGTEYICELKAGNGARSRLPVCISRCSSVRGPLYPTDSDSLTNLFRYHAYLLFIEMDWRLLSCLFLVHACAVAERIISVNQRKEMGLEASYLSAYSDAAQ